MMNNCIQPLYVKMSSDHYVYSYMKHWLVVKNKLQAQICKKVKKYQNKDNRGFITGFDVTSKEAEERRLKRAKRFGLKAKEKKANINETEVLPSSIENLPALNQDAKLRPDALLLFGVTEMSTKDVFDYFHEYIPDSIEWIDDQSCVVVWDDQNSTKRAFANLGMKFTPSQDSWMIGEDNGLENIWKVGVKHPKSKQLLMRYATTADKKMKGAGSRSLYYLIHGRPEQHKRKANKRGIVSSSRRRKINADQFRIKTELDRGPEVEIRDQYDEDVKEEMDIDEPPIKVLISELMIRGETPSGNLYADQKSRSDARSRLDRHAAYVRNRRFANELPNSAKMDEGFKNDMDLDVKPDLSDLRLKLKSHEQRFDMKVRPSLSIKITKD